MKEGATYDADTEDWWVLWTNRKVETSTMRDLARIYMKIYNMCGKFEL